MIENNNGMRLSGEKEKEPAGRDDFLTDEEEELLKKIDEENGQKIKKAEEDRLKMEGVELMLPTPEWEEKFAELYSLKNKILENDSDRNFMFTNEFSDHYDKIQAKYGIFFPPKYYYYHLFSGSSLNENDKKYIAPDFPEPELSVEIFILSEYEKWKEMSGKK